MRLGIAGAGLIVHHLLSFIHEVKGISLVAVCARDNQEDRLGILCRDNNIQTYYTHYDEMLKSPEIDTIYVAVNNQLHYSFAKKALLADKNVICEKPFTVTLDEFEALCTLAKERNLILIEAITNLYLSNFLAIKEHLKELGAIRIVSLNYSQYSSRYDDFKKGIIKPCFDPEMAGGALMDLNVYNIHFVVNLFGKPKKTEYFPNIERGIDVSGILILSYETFQCVLIAAKDCNAPVCTTIQGDEGCIVMPVPTNTCEHFSVIKNGKEPQEYSFWHGEHRMLQEFVAFEKVVREHDMAFAEKMQQQSRIVMCIIEETRRQPNK